MMRAMLSAISRSTVASSRRAFHTTPVAAKTVGEAAHDVNIKVGKGLASAIEKGEHAVDATKHAVGGSNVKEVAENVNKSVGRGLASAIEKGEQVTESTKKTLGAASAKTKETTNAASQKAKQASTGLRKGKEDFQADVKKELRK